MSRIKLVIGVFILYAAIHAVISFSNYKINHNSHSGNIIENNIEAPEFEDVFVPSKTK